MPNFDASKHPRAGGGRFGDTVGAQRLSASGVTGAHKIVVNSSRVRKYAGHATVDAYANAHKKGRAHALRELAADHKAGKISFAAEVESAVASYVAPDRALLTEVTSGFQPGDYLTRLNNSKKYPPGITIGDYLKADPKGQIHAAKTIAADVKAGRLMVERPKANIPKPPPKPPVAPPAAKPAVQIQFGAKTSEIFKADINASWAKVPNGAKTLLHEKGVSVHAPEKLLDVAPELAGQQPRGWSEGKTWENVGGVYMGGATKRCIAAEKSVSVHHGVKALRPENRGGAVMLHETGHAVDHAMGYASETGAFRQAYSEDVAQYLKEGGTTHEGQYSYFMQPGNAGRSEMFAEMFADRLGKPTNSRHPPLSARFPKCAAHMDQLLKELR